MRGVDSHLPVVHHFTHALRVCDSNFIILFAAKTRTSKTASSLSNFEILKSLFLVLVKSHNLVFSGVPILVKLKESK
jgi:hypothetical protein